MIKIKYIELLARLNSEHWIDKKKKNVAAQLSSFSLFVPVFRIWSVEEMGK